MLSKNAASMIIGTSMDKETCLILGQVSLNLLYRKKKLQKDICGPGRRLTRKQLTSRPDHLWPELWKTMGKNAKLKDKQKWSNEKLHLENARKLRGIYFIDPEDKEFKETIKNARKKSETPIAPAMPCKILKKNCGSGGSNKIKTRLAYSRSWWIYKTAYERIITKSSWTPYCRKRKNSLQHYNSVHKFIPMPQAMKIPAAKAAADKEWEKLEKNYGVEPDDSQKQKKRWSMKQGRRAQRFILHHWWTKVIWKMLSWRQSTKNTKVEVVIRVDFVKDDSGSYAVFTEQGSSASKMTATKSHGYHFQIAWLRWTSSGRQYLLMPR